MSNLAATTEKHELDELTFRIKALEPEAQYYLNLLKQYLIEADQRHRPYIRPRVAVAITDDPSTLEFTVY